MKKYLSMAALSASVAIFASCGGSASEDESKAAGGASGAAVGKLISNSSTGLNLYTRVAAVAEFAAAKQRKLNPQSEGDEMCSTLESAFETEEGISCEVGDCGIDGTTVNINVSCTSTETTIDETTCGETTYSMKKPYFKIAMNVSATSGTGTVKNEVGGDVKGGKITDYTALACKMDMDLEKLAEQEAKLAGSEEEYAAAVAEMVSCELGGKKIDIKAAMSEYKGSCDATN